MVPTLAECLLAQPATVAPRLLGAHLIRQYQGKQLIAQIVETEAYDQTDAASHSYNGETPRSKVMFGPPGCLYIYFTYGMHYCCNVVTGTIGQGSAVLIRAVEPLSGEQIMIDNRHGKGGTDVTNGPAKTCQAFAIDMSLNGHDLRQSPLLLLMQPELPLTDIVTTRRIGITKAQDKLWRFYIRNNPYVSNREIKVVGSKT